MPYELKKVKGGYKVQKKGGELTSTGRRYFSNSPLPKERAEAQIKALYVSERQRMPSPGRTAKAPTRRKKASSPTRVAKKKLKSPTRKRQTSPKRVRK